jgi:TolB protein
MLAGFLNQACFCNEANPTSQKVGKIAYICWKVPSLTGGGSVRIMNEDGSDPKILFECPRCTLTMPLSVSPDGRYVAFASDEGGNGDIHTVSTDGKQPKKLTTDSAFDTAPAWSHDGRLIAFSSDRDGKADLLVMDANGANQRKIVSTASKTYPLEGQPCWSTDDKKIAVVRNVSRSGLVAGQTKIYVINVGTGQQEAITDAVGEGAPVWSTDGRGLFYLLRKDNETSLCFFDVEKRSAKAILQGKLRIRNFTPFNEKLLLEAYISGSPIAGNLVYSLFQLSARGSEPTSLTKDQKSTESPCWSPSGQKIAFVMSRSAEKGSYGDDIFVMSADGTGIVQLTDTGDAKIAPVWFTLRQ